MANFVRASLLMTWPQANRIGGLPSVDYNRYFPDFSFLILSYLNLQNRAGKQWMVMSRNLQFNWQFFGAKTLNKDFLRFSVITVTKQSVVYSWHFSTWSVPAEPANPCRFWKVQMSNCFCRIQSVLHIHPSVYELCSVRKQGIIWAGLVWSIRTYISGSLLLILVKACDTRDASESHIRGLKFSMLILNKWIRNTNTASCSPPTLGNLRYVSSASVSSALACRLHQNTPWAF